ncbi:adenosylcobalamin-dependent ribonucleoside-diphosphate reductase [Candidatus Woesearchaeota archaeon]|nr:adenosylcobalamin-dependent ribonucleoside-diphosphate reductase [Candidatus Woesearchaeota archaeon]
MKIEGTRSIMIQQKKIEATENQLKVIKDKYLKDSPSVEAWLENIAENIALAEILYANDELRLKAFEGTRHTIVTADGPGAVKPNMVLFHQGLNHDQRHENHRKFIENLYRLAKENTQCADIVRETADRFYNLMANWEFLPNSPTLMNAGRKLQQLSACYVLPVGDSIEEIYESVKNMALIHKSGGGTGFDFSHLRPAKDTVFSTKGVASGPLSFMSIFDKSTEVVKQGGQRRGANMGIMRYDHPSILDFIHCKRDNGFLENFNISVALDAKFMDAVKNNKEYDLINPKDKSVSGKLNAREVFDKMCNNAWVSGDPGFVVIDRINNSDSNPTPAQGQIESTNPCGEQPLLPYEPCNLGSINLSRFVLEDGSDMDWNRFRECVHTGMHFLDNVIEVNNYPIPEIEEIAKRNRRVGLGVMGWAESLVKLNLPYNSDAAMQKAEEVMAFINDEALNASCNLAKMRGVFPGFKDCIYDKNGSFFRGQDVEPRNSARTTIAPTGTIGITAGLQGAGIEPFFAIVYVRYNAAGIDALKEGKKPAEKDTFFEVNPYFEKIAQQHNYFGLKKEELYKKIDDNHKAVLGIKEIPEKIQKLFLTSHDLTPMDHVRIQAAFQKYCNNAVSKTVNLKNEATVDDIREVYMKAYESGCKGVTIYRDGSKSLQILNLAEKKTDAQKEKPVIKKEKHLMEMSSYYMIETGHGPMHVHINYDQQGPTKVFANISPSGTEVSGLTTALAILISKYLDMEGDAVKLLKHLNSIKGDRPFGFGPKRVDSIPHGMAKALRDHLVKTGKMKPFENGQTLLGSSPVVQKPDNGLFVLALHCPKCYSTNAEMVSGCSEPTCFDCGYSKCS